VFGLPAQRIEEGAPANLTLFHPEKEWVVEPGQLASKSQNTPLHGQRLRGQIRAVFNNHQSHFFAYR
jgi:dihydroorotase